MLLKLQGRRGRGPIWVNPEAIGCMFWNARIGATRLHMLTYTAHTERLQVLEVIETPEEIADQIAAGEGKDSDGNYDIIGYTDAELD